MGELDDLLRRFLQQGDAGAMEEIVRRTRPRLLEVARRIGSPQDAEDSVQATYHALLRRGGAPMEAPLIAWLLTVVVRVAYRRKAIQRRELQLADQLALPSDEPGPRRAVEVAERDRSLRAEVGRLPPHYRDVVVLHHVEGLSVRACARLLDVPEETVRTRLKRARRLLRGRLHPGILHGLLVLPWWLSDNARPSLIQLGVVMKTRIAAVGVLLVVAGLLYVGRDIGRTEPVARTSEARTKERSALADREATPSRSSLDAGTERELPPPVDFEAVDRDRDVHGSVVTRDGEPVAGALLQLVDYPWRRGTLLHMERYHEEEAGPETRSARDGSFRIPWRRGRMGWLRVSARGFAERLVPMVQAGERTRIEMDEGATIAIRAIDSRGRPVCEAPVRLFHSDSGRPEFAREHHGETDAEGRCVLTGVAGPSLATAELFHAELGTPGWRSVAVPAAGERAELEVVFPEGRTLRGRVSDADTGEPIAGARVGIGWVQRGAVVSGEDGRYALAWSGRGWEELHVSHPRYGRTWAAVGTDVVIDFELRVGDRVVGRLIDGDGRGVSGARVAAIGSVRDGEDQTTSRGYDESRADGSFEVTGLRHDLFHALVVVRRGFGRVLYDFGPADERGGTIDLGTIVVRPGHSIEGRVVDAAGEALARVPVELVGANADRGRYGPRAGNRNMRYGEQESRATDDLGRFRFPDLAPGTYTLVATRDGGTRAARAVVLEEEDVRDVVLRFDGTRAITVRVVDVDGRPVANAFLGARCERGSLGGRTDGRGELTLHATGPVTDLAVHFVHDGTGRAAYLPSDAIDRVGDERSEVEIVLRPGAFVTGTVRRPDGTPVPRSYVEATVGGTSLRSALADEDGRFRVVVPRDSRIDLVFAGAAQRGGVLVREWEGALRGVPAGAREVDFRLSPIARDGSLTVVVLDPDGNPLAGRKVGCRFGTSLAGPVATDRRGRATFANLLRTSCTPYVFPRPADHEVMIPPVVESVTPDGREVTLRFRRGVVRTGRVEPARSAGILFQKVEDGRPRRIASAQAGEDGRFRAFLPVDEGDGPFVVTAQAQGEDELLTGRLEDVHVDGPEPVIELHTVEK